MANAVMNRVLVEPFELPLPSATASHTIELTLTNDYPGCDMTYNLKHLPAGTMSLAAALVPWQDDANQFSHFLSSSTPTAQVTLPKSVVVPKQGSAKVSHNSSPAAQLQLLERPLLRPAGCDHETPQRLRLAPATCLAHPVPAAIVACCHHASLCLPAARCL